MTASELLELGLDELLTTTRSVRKRLDFTHPVNPDVVRECIDIALQAPAGANVVHTRFLVVTDHETRLRMGDVYRRAYDIYRTLDDVYIGNVDKGSPEANERQRRSAESADYLATTIGEAPVLVLACGEGMRVDGLPAMMSIAWLGSLLPSVWNSMLAARARGLGTAWTTNHLILEEEMAELLGIPFELVQQVCLIPVAYSHGTTFRRAGRPPVDEVTRWQRWT